MVGIEGTKTDEILRIRRGELRHQMNETQRGQALKGMENTKNIFKRLKDFLYYFPKNKSLNIHQFQKHRQKQIPLQP